MGVIRPLFSAIRMNLSGGTRPNSGCCQRRSASNPVILPVAISICGWYTRKSSLFVERQPQAVLQGQSLHSLSVHVVGKEPEIVASIILGAIHGRIGILDQGFAVRAVFGENADAQLQLILKG